MDKMWQVLITLVGTFCLTIIIGLIGVFYGKVDAQFIEGLVSGSLVSLITMMIKDITNQNSPVTTPAEIKTTPIMPIVAPTNAIPTDTIEKVS